MAGVWMVRCLLWLYPRSFRRTFSADMETAYRERYHDIASRGWWAVWRLNVRTAWDLVRSAVREHVASSGRPRPQPRRPAPRPSSATAAARWIDDLQRDLVYGIRSLRRAPGFTATAVIVLSLGIGGTTTMFSLLDAVLLRSLPYPDAHALVDMWETFRTDQSKSVSYPNYRDWADQSTTYESMGASLSTTLTLGGDGPAQMIPGAAMTPSMFTTLAVAPIRGRHLVDDDNRVGAPPVAIVSHRFWLDRLGGGDPVGRTIVLNGRTTEVVGVMPAAFTYPGENTDLWVPLVPEIPTDVDTRGSRPGISVVGRLVEGRTIADAATEMHAIAARLAGAHPGSNAEHSVGLQSLQERYVGDVRGVFWTLMAAVGMVLVIASANVANLLLARGLARQREIGMRIALGASRRRIAAQLLTEHLALAGVAAVVGVVLAMWGVSGAAALVGSSVSVPGLASAGLDARVLAFTGAVAIVTGLTFGLLPALATARAGVVPGLHDRSDGGRRTARGVREGLIIIEVAVSLTLVVGAGLMLRSVSHIYNADPGFEPSGLASFRINASGPAYEESAARLALYERVLERAASEPGVEDVAAIHPLPMVGWGSQWGVYLQDSPVLEPDERLRADFFRTTPRYFETMQIPLREGRTFAETDDASAPPVAVVDVTFADRYYPQGALGRRVSQNGVVREIVGVVGHVKNYGITEDTRVQFYVPAAQTFVAGLSFVARTNADPEVLSATLGNVAGQVDVDQPVYMVAPVSRYVDRTVARERVLATLLSAFAVVSLVLASVGLYGVIAYTVSQREAEMGVRVALGANARQVASLVIGRGMFLAGIGIAIGLVASTVGSRALAGLLFNVPAVDPFTYTTVAGLLAASALFACAVPARRAMKVDPTDILR